MTIDDDAAVTLYQDLARPVTKELALTPLVFDMARLRCTTEDARALFDRLHLIHEAVRPRKPMSGDSEDDRDQG